MTGKARAPKTSWSLSTSSTGRTRGQASIGVKLPAATLTWSVTQRAGRLPRVTVSSRSATKR